MSLAYGCRELDLTQDTLIKIPHIKHVAMENQRSALEVVKVMLLADTDHISQTLLTQTFENIEGKKFSFSSIVFKIIVHVLPV